MSNNNEEQFKIIFLGDSSVGKTNIIYKYLDIQKETGCTISPEFYSKMIDFEGKEFKL